MPIELQDTTEESQSTVLPADSGLRKLNIRFGAKLTATDRRFFTEQLSLLLETGSNLYQALSMLYEQSQQPEMTEILEQLMDAVANGRSFASALSEHPEMFSTTYVNLVAAAESGGFLHEVLNELLMMEERADELNSTVRSALAYPVLLSVFSVAVIVFVLVVVFPKFSDMFAKIHDQLPMTTVVLLQASDLLRNHWMALMGSLAGSVFLAVRWKNSDDGRVRLDKWKLTLPVLRPIYIQVYLVQSLRVISLSLANGVNIIETLKASRDVVQNIEMQKFFEDVEEEVQQGNGIAVGFERSDLMPLLAKRMIATGEDSASLPKVMARLSDFYERELTRRLKAFSKMAEPVMIMVMGVIVGVIVSSLILPIFKLSRAVT